MRLSRWFLTAVMMIVAFRPALAQNLPYQVSVNGSVTNRYIDDQKIGSIANGGVQYYLDIGNSRALALEYYTNENRVSDTLGVELGQESFGFGLFLPTSPVKIKLAGSIEQYMLGADYWALGAYPELSRRWGTVYMAVERDADATVLTSGRLSTSLRSWATSIGASFEDSRHRDAEQRVGFEVARRFTRMGLMTMAGATVNPDDAPTWVAGLGYPASADSGSGLNPAMLGIMREKPEGTYVMALATLWGQTLNAGTFQGIGESIFNSSFSRIRVVRNRDFNTVAVGGGYDQLDFGRVVTNYNFLDVDAGGGVHVRSSNIGLFGTLPTRFSLFGLPVDDPFLGVDNQIITDLVYDAETGVLADYRQDWTTVTFGCKFRLYGSARPSPAKQSGYLRLKAFLRFGQRFDGGYLGATFWH